MADTIRLLAALQTLLADNGTGAISAQDVRDFLVSAIPTGRSATKVVASATATDKQKADADYVCDGTADNVEINTAIQALGTAGVVRLVGPLFNIAARISLPYSGLVLQGDGQFSTYLYLVNGANDNVIRIASATAKQGVQVRALAIDGNKDNQTDDPGGTELRSGIFVQGSAGGAWYDLMFENLLVQNCRGMGISADGQSAAHVVRPVFRNLKLWSNGASGGNPADGMHVGYADDVTIIGVSALNNTDTGIACDFVTGLQELACVCRGNVWNQFTFARASTQGFIIGCIADGASGAGAYGIRTGKFGFAPDPGSSSNLWIVDCLIKGCGTAGILNEDHTILKWHDNIFSSNAADYVEAGAVVLPLPHNNIGFVSEKGGTNTIPSGATFVTFNHGLSGMATALAAKNITVTPTNSPTNDPGNLYVFGVSATQITVACRNDPGAGGATFAWSVRMDV